MISDDELKELCGRWVYLKSKGEEDVLFSGRILETPNSNPNKLRYPYSVITGASDVYLSTLKYVTIPGDRSKLEDKEGRLIIESEYLSNPTLMLSGNPEYSKYLDFLQK